jgi:hypothetical protein
MRSAQGNTIEPIQPMLVISRNAQTGLTSRSIGTSATFHVAFLALLLFARFGTFPAPSPEPSLSVELVALPPPEPKIQPKPQDEPRPENEDVPTNHEPSEPPTHATTEPAEPADEMVDATNFFSASILADRRSKDAKAALKSLAPDERIVQLCNIEAMAQIHKWRTILRPDNIVAYAMADPKVSLREITADGAAFRARKRWYRVRYKCSVNADLNNVQSFAFSVGDEIPKADWSSHYLTEDDGPPD